MKTRFNNKKLTTSLLIIAAALSTQSRAGLVQNPSFELNYNDTWPHYSSTDLWAGGSGINDASGPFHNGGTPIPDRNRANFMQGSVNLSQDITGLTPGKQYWIQFFYDARACCGGTIDFFTKFNGVDLDKITNVRPVTGGNPYLFRSVAFTPDVDSGNLMFSTLAAGDATVLLDGVTIVQRDADNVVVANPSFEASGDPLEGEDGTISPGGIAGWTGEGVYGVNVSGVGPFANNGTPPDQDHVAFISGPGFLSQNVLNLLVGKPYQVTISYNAQTGQTPHIQLKSGDTILFEEDVTAVGGDAAYKQKTVSFNATDISSVLTIAQTVEGATLLIDNIKVVGEISVPLPPLKLSPPVSELAPGQKVTVTVTVPNELLAIRDATIALRSLNANVASLVGADENGVVSLSFAKNGPNEKTLEVEAVGRGTTRLEVVELSGLNVVDDVAIAVVTSFVRNASFETSAAPGGVGYGAVLGWTGGSGLNTVNGPFHDNGVIPDRGQIAFLQGAQNMSQTITGLEPGKTYALGFYYNARAAGGTTIDLTVKFAGAELVKIPAIAAVGDGVPYNYYSVFFTATANSGLLEFITVPSGDATLLLDAVNIVEVNPTDIPIINASFEASGSPVGVGYHNGGLAGWTMTGGHGVNINGVGPFTDNGLSSSQDRVLLMQGAASATQTINGLTPGQKYTLIYEVNARNCCTAGPTLYNVTLGEEALVVDEEIAPVGAQNEYVARYVVFTATAESADLRFAHTPPDGDRTLLLDNVRIAKGEVLPPVHQPEMTIARQDDGTIRITWPVTDEGFKLQSTAALPNGWADNNAAVQIEDPNNVVILNVGQTTFFRLVK